MIKGKQSEAQLDEIKKNIIQNWIKILKVHGDEKVLKDEETTKVQCDYQWITGYNYNNIFW